jgi:hypothetical protein
MSLHTKTKTTMTMMTTKTTKCTANNMRRKWTGYEGEIKNI